MKRALSVTAVTALSLLVFLFAGYAQEEGALAVAELLEQELASMESAFGGLSAFMAELITEVKGNMADIDTFEARVNDLFDVVEAISVELKTAEGKIIGLRTDVDALGEAHEALKTRVAALEAGLASLSAFVDELKARLDVNVLDLATLREEFDLLVSDYEACKAEFYGFREMIVADIEALRAGIYGDLDALRDALTADVAALAELHEADVNMLKAQQEDLANRVQALEAEDVGTFKKKVIELERAMAALAIKVENNRTKLEGFDHAIAGLASQLSEDRDALMSANRDLMGDYDLRLAALESTDWKSQIDSLYFISIVALLAGVGALIWGFLGNN